MDYLNGRQIRFTEANRPESLNFIPHFVYFIPAGGIRTQAVNARVAEKVLPFIQRGSHSIFAKAKAIRLIQAAVSNLIPFSPTCSTSRSCSSGQ